MTIRHLTIFLAVSRNHSVTKAANELNMTQPAVSIALRELEEYYQARLVERRGRGLALTEAGERLSRCAQGIIDQLAEIASVLKGGQGLRLCRIGANITVGETVLASLLAELRRRLPGLELRCQINNAAAMGELLAAGAVDWAILDRPAGRPGLEAAELFSEEMAVVAAPESAPAQIRAAELAGRALMLRESGSASRLCVEAAFASLGIRAAPWVESVSDLSLLELARQGLGVTILPLELVREDLKAGRLRRIRTADIRFLRTYYLVRDPSRYLSPAAAKALALAKAGLGRRSHCGKPGSVLN